MVRLAEALRYKAEGRGFDSRWGHYDSSLTKSLQPHFDPGVDSLPNRNEYHGYLMGVKTAGED